MNIKRWLDEKIAGALGRVGAGGASAIVKQSQKAAFGQYQVNGVMGAAKRLKINPRQLAARVIAELDLPQAESIEIAGPGFINIHLHSTFIAKQVIKLRADDRLGVSRQAPRTIVIDYSSPNLAKEMHIGHLRSTAIGDAAARVLEFLGHKVIRANHVGDWGAQFGSLLAYMEQLSSREENLSSELKDLEVFYQSASARFRSDEGFAKKARACVVKLQRGDEKYRRLWQGFIDESIQHCQAVYDRLDITLTPADIMAESAYNDALPLVISDLQAQGLIKISAGAKCVFLAQFKGKDGAILPAMMQKSDGGYPYMASDLAAVRYRIAELGADEALYFVDARQQLHLSQLFAVARAAGYIKQQSFKHLPFGVILQADGTPFKTRDGAAVKLAEVIEEAIRRAHLLLKENLTLALEDKQEIARIVGTGAIKYAELSKNRTTDYMFDWDTMLSFDGNTAPYLQYAYARIRSILRKAGVDGEQLRGHIDLHLPLEKRLAMKLLQFTEAVEAVVDDYQANILCNYLFDLAGRFMSFYEACPILSETEAIKTSRLLLADTTARVIRQGLNLLGIRVLDRM